ncbi:MAG: hypothetical protein COW65_15560 [Cytophagales bacterium CG18_big_fil_WC_8_21_14_2_50_42_9]|nr:MAG: hypothetical protein COW65_15560 [Cytophagales bacterium CG18_big_fil_WC_8_21_14_2_50_42_9]
MKKVFLLFFLLQLSGLNLVAQSTCPEKFAAYNSQGQRVTTLCAGEKIRFKACDPAIDPDKEYYDFDKSNGLAFPDTVKFFTFPAAGTYTVTQLINTSGSGQASQQSPLDFTVIDAPVPGFIPLLCALNQIRISITDKTYDTFLVDFGDGSVQSVNRGEAVPAHQYRQSGTYKIRVTGQYNGATCSNFQESTIQTLPAVSTLHLESATITSYAAVGSISLTWSGNQPEYYYLIEKIINNTVTVLDTIKNPATASVTYSLSNIDTRASICFRIRPTDRCGTVLPALSNTVCTVPVTATTGNQNITLTWPAYPDPAALVQYEITRNGQVLASVPASQNSYPDNEALCGTRYCYIITALLRNQGASISNEVCETAVSTQAPPAGYLSSTFTPANAVQLTFVTPENAQQITYQKKIGNGSFAELAVSNQLSFSDPDVNSGQQPFCYQATYLNACNQVSAVSNITCPIWLAVTSTNNSTANLNWSAYEGFPAGIAGYEVQILDAASAVLQTIPVSSTTQSAVVNISQNQQILFRIRALGNNMAGKTFSNTVNLIQEASIFIPNAFSPNGDHLNDIFEVKGRFLAAYRMLIYDRWGQILFDSKNQNQGWDGRFNGKEIPTGTYAYRITGQDAAGKEFTKTGTVTLLR